METKDHGQATKDDANQSTTNIRRKFFSVDMPPIYRAVIQAFVAIGIGFLATTLYGATVRDFLFGIRLPLAELGVSNFQSYVGLMPWPGLFVGTLFLIFSLILIKKAHAFYTFRYQEISNKPRISFIAVLLVFATIMGSVSLLTSADNNLSQTGALGWSRPFENFFESFVLYGGIVQINEDSVIVEDDDGNKFEISKEDLSVHNDAELSVGNLVAVVLPEPKDDIIDKSDPDKPVLIDIEKPIVVNPEIPEPPSEPEPPIMTDPTPSPIPEPEPEQPDPQTDEITIPGRIEAEDFSRYYDTSSGNIGDGTCRSETDVDLKNEGNDNCIVGWFDSGEWLEYDVAIAQTGTYTLSARVARGSSSSTSFDVMLGETNVATGVVVENTGSWDNLTTIQQNNIMLPAGSHSLRIVRNNDWFDLDWIELTIQSGSTPIPPSVPDPEPETGPYADILTFNPNNPESVIFAQGFNARGTGEYTDAEISADFTQNGNNNSSVSTRGIQPRIENQGGNNVFVKEFASGSCCNSAHGTFFNVNLAQDYDELYLAYRVRVNNDFDPVLGGKLPGFCGGDCNSGGNVPTGYDGWSARNMWRSGGELVQYMYHPDQSGTWGSSWTYSSAEVSDTWITIEHRVAMNTPGQNNGVMQAWVDGSIELNRTNVRYRETTNIAIDKFIFSHFWGGSTSAWAPTQNEKFYFDDFVISTKPITH